MNQKNEYGQRMGYWEEYHHNGKIKAKGNYSIKNRKYISTKDGNWEFYHDNGKLWAKGNYIDGKGIGLWKHYHDNGKLRLQQYYS